MQNAIHLPLTAIVIKDRVRSSTDDIDKLKASITRWGLLQPLLLDQDNVLQDGWRRYTALNELGVHEVAVYYRNRLTEAEYYEVELESNMQRLGFTWQETVQAVCRVHTTRTREALCKGDDWSLAMTGDLLGGYSSTYVWNCLKLNPLLVSPDFAECETITDAVRKFWQAKEDVAMATLAKRTALRPATPPEFVANLNTQAPGPKAGYTADACPDCGGVSPAALTCLTCKGTGYAPITDTIINLSGTLIKGDSVYDILPDWPPDCVDHIITDPPYAIDVDFLQQASNALMDVSRIRDTHQVEDNLQLFREMFWQFYRVMKPGGFCVCFCDIMSWQPLYDNAENAGFGVQRWPIVWHKTSTCMNQMAHVNLTKNVELAIVCRKGEARLPKPVTTCVIACPNDAERLSNPFAKPSFLWKTLLEWFTIQGQTVLDPFAGEGSSTLTALRFCRHALAIEKEERHFNYLLESVKEHWTTVLNGKVQFK